VIGGRLVYIILGERREEKVFPLMDDRGLELTDWVSTCYVF